MLNKPFCITGSVGRFAPCYEARGYLPPIEINYEYIYDEQWAELKRRFLDAPLYGELVLDAEQEPSHPCPIPREKVYRGANPPKELPWQGFRI